MRLATLHTAAGLRAAVRHDEDYIDLHATDAAFPPTIRQLLAAGPEVLEHAARAGKRTDAVRIPVQKTRLAAPIGDPQKIVCLGLNYRDHAAETNAQIPRDPILFSKYPTAIIGPGERIVLPAVSSEVDYEAELVIVVGKRGRHLTVNNALGYVAGYTVGHDVSARDWQLKKDGKQWMAGKTFDTFAPTGPELVMADEVPEPENLGIRLRLNGRVMQDSNTRNMIFGVATTIAYLSKVFTLEPGDLVFTGTPPGVGIARKPPVFLRAGDVVEVEIDGIGLLKNPVVAEPV
jgi:2-keto-4-pentenoate hydratase/2-oxohepta-3-ene-1,7-dioic acid hydratase in catechol pathway